MARMKTQRQGTLRARTGVKLGPLDSWVGFNLRMAQEATFAAFSRLSREVGESPGRFAALTLIAENPGISQSTLGQASGRDKSSMTPVLDDLVRRGLVRRSRTDEDRRSYKLALTPAGEKTLTRLMACARKHEQNLDRLIGPSERVRFLRTLKRVQKIS